MSGRWIWAISIAVALGIGIYLAATDPVGMNASIGVKALGAVVVSVFIWTFGCMPLTYLTVTVIRLRRRKEKEDA